MKPLSLFFFNDSSFKKSKFITFHLVNTFYNAKTLKIHLIRILIFLTLTFGLDLLAKETIIPPSFTQKSELTLEEIETKEGIILFVLVDTLDYLSSGSDKEYVNEIAKIVSEKKNKVFLLKHSGYNPHFQTIGLNLFSSGDEEKTFQNYLHDLCFDDRALSGKEENYAHYTKLTNECYIYETRIFLKGARGQFFIYRYFGRIPSWNQTSEYFWGGVLYLLLFISSLPHLFLFLFVFSFFKKYFKYETYNRKLATVLIPIVYGVGWLFASVYIGSEFRWNFWGMGTFKMFFYLSGLFFGLGFVGVMLLVNRIFYPEENSLPDWAIGLILLFSPILIFAAGAGGAKTNSSSSTSTNSTSSTNDSKTTGGGKSGGGGAGGNF